MPLMGIGSIDTSTSRFHALLPIGSTTPPHVFVAS